MKHTPSCCIWIPASSLPGFLGLLCLLFTLIQHVWILSFVSIANVVSGATAVVVTWSLFGRNDPEVQRLSLVRKLSIIGIFWATSLCLDIFVARRLFA